MPLHVKVTGKKRISISIGTRQYNTDAIKSSVVRKEDFIKLGLDAEFDLSSAIFAIARLRNTNEFDIDWT